MLDLNGIEGQFSATIVSLKPDEVGKSQVNFQMSPYTKCNIIDGGKCRQIIPSYVSHIDTTRNY